MTEEQQDYTDPKQHKKRKKKYDLQASREKEDIGTMLNNPAGRRVLWRIMDQSNLLIYSSLTPFNGSIKAISPRYVYGQQYNFL